MTAQDYPISFPYGATSSPYTKDHPHRGDDRACPDGTPVVVHGVTIGWTGHTGFVTGPHLHIQEWSGDPLNTRKPQNAFSSGVVTKLDPKQSWGDHSFGISVTIQGSDGWCDTYCHLSKIGNIKVGDKIPSVSKGDEVKPTHDEVVALFRKYAGKEPTSEQVKYYIARDVRTLYLDLLNFNNSNATRLKNQLNSLWTKVRAVFGK